MSVELSRMTPAPWFGGSDGYVTGPPDECFLFCPQEATGDDAEGVALLRNALAVQMRMGWHAWKNDRNGSWYAEMPKARSSESDCKQTYPNGWPDPATAIVEAYRWWQVNVKGEGKGEAMSDG